MSRLSLPQKKIDIFDKLKGINSSITTKNDKQPPGEKKLYADKHSCKFSWP
jgi:hypothetical protein